MATRLSTATANTQVQARANQYTAIDIYTGAQPATGNTAASGTLLGTVTGITFGTAASGSVAKTGTWSTTAVASGTAGWYRLRDAGSTASEDGAFGAEATIDNASIVSGGTILINTCVLTQPLA